MRIAALIACLTLAFAADAHAQSPMQPPATLKLDHFWIATATNAPNERAALQQAGFRISPTINRHQGQGTASQTVEFENGYLELIYPDDSVPISGAAGQTGHDRFVERADWRHTNVAPFGVAVTRTPATPSPFPFETWRVTADWMGPGNYMEMLTPRGSPAVNVAVHPDATDEHANLRAIAEGGAAAWPFQHPNGARRITNLEIIVARPEGLPPSAQFVNTSGAAQMRASHEWLAVLTLDNGAQHQRADLRPALPLIVHY